MNIQFLNGIGEPFVQGKFSLPGKLVQGKYEFPGEVLLLGRILLGQSCFVEIVVWGKPYDRWARSCLCVWSL